MVAKRLGRGWHYNPTHGPDFTYHRWGIRIELTTTGQLQRHMTRYRYLPMRRWNYVTYHRPWR